MRLQEANISFSPTCFCGKTFSSRPNWGFSQHAVKEINFYYHCKWIPFVVGFLSAPFGSNISRKPENGISHSVSLPALSCTEHHTMMTKKKTTATDVELKFSQLNTLPTPDAGDGRLNVFNCHSPGVRNKWQYISFAARRVLLFLCFVLCCLISGAAGGRAFPRQLSIFQATRHKGNILRL